MSTLPSTLATTKLAIVIPVVISNNVTEITAEMNDTNWMNVTTPLNGTTNATTLILVDLTTLIINTTDYWTSAINSTMSTPVSAPPITSTAVLNDTTTLSTITTT